MKTFYWVLIVSSVMGAGGLGYAIWDDVRPIPSECGAKPLERQPVNDMTAKIRITNHGDPPSVRVCAFTTQGGMKLYDDRFDVPVGPEQTFYAALPMNVGYLHFEFGGQSAAGIGQPWSDCRSKAFEVVLSQGDPLGGSRTSSCIDSVPPQEALRQGTKAVRPALAPPGLALAALGGAGVFAALAIRFRAPMGFVFAGFFTRLAKPRLLDQGVRSQIHQLVSQEPGIHTSELQRRLEVGNGHLAYHLRVLERERMLSRLGGPFLHHYFVGGRYGPAEMRRLAALRDPNLRLLSVLVRARPGQALATLAEEAQFSMSRASRAAKRLVRAGLATAQRQGRELRLYPAA